MQITWYGHSCFLLAADNGVSILTDPCDAATGYRIQNIACTAVTVSHDHHDHNCLDDVAGDPLVIRTTGAHNVCGIPVTGFATWHDEVQGQKRGANIVFRYEMDGMRLVHLGDLGHALDDESVNAIGEVDVLFAPVGGVYTIDSKLAKSVVETLDPKVFIPMHYKTPVLQFALDDIDPLLAVNETYAVHRLNASACRLTPDTLGEKRLLLLDYAR